MGSSPQPDSSSGLPCLEIEDPNSGHRTVQLEHELTRLGRGADNDIQILVAHVSKHHAEIRHDDGKFIVTDAGSKAGLYVNGNLYRERLLADGDVLTFGPLPPPRIVFRANVRVPGLQAATGTSLAMSLTDRNGGQPGLENLSKFLEFSRLLGGQLSVSEILEDVVDLAIEITAADRGFLILDAGSDQLSFQMARLRNKVTIPADDIEVSETIVKEVLKSGETKVVSDMDQESTLAAQMSVMNLKLGSAVAMPMWRFSLPDTASRAEATDEVFGVLYLDSRDRRDAFSQIDLGLLETLARDASSVIENARLLRESDEKKRMEQELATAREVQAALLPQEFWADPHFELAGCSVPCHDLGGDYLDQFRMSDGSCGFVIADVSGKGLPAALLAAALQGILYSESSVDQPLAKMVERINHSICRLAPDGAFITFFCGAIDPDGTLRYVDAGHGLLGAISADGTPRECKTGGNMALGLSEDATYREYALDMHPGDVIAIYTDGVSETPSPQNELFGEDRVGDILNTAKSSDVTDIVNLIRDEVQKFTGDQPFRDDLTMVVVRYRGAA